MPRFKHSPLTSATDEIRLLSLDLDGSLDDIQCTLETHRLDSRPVYCALSYEWGDPNLPMDIKVNGNVFQARHNLWLFLHRLKAARRSQGNISGPTSKLWIDALCIDQTDVAERSAQVQLMGKIYREACGVIVWLGWSDGLDPNVTSTLAKEIASDPIYGHKSYIDLSFNGPCQQTESRDDATFQEIYTFMLELCKKRYWTRRWIVQEILMAKRVLLVYGQQELPWAAVCMTFERCQTYTKTLFDSKVPAYYSTNLSTFDTILESTAARIWRHQNMRKGSNSGTSLATLLQDYRSMQCEAVYDRVYALKGLTENELLDTDYSISPPELYSRVFSTVLQQDRHAFRHWRDYAADCGLLFQPLGLPDIAQEHSNQTSVLFRTAATDHVISMIDFATFLQGIDDPTAGKNYIEKWRFLSTSTNSLRTGTQDIFQEFSRGLGAQSRTAVTSLYLKDDENLPTPDRNINKPTIMFCSPEKNGKVGHLLITWACAKSGDSLCPIAGCCYLVLRPKGENLQIVGPAWELVDQNDFAVLQIAIDSAVLGRSNGELIKEYLFPDHVLWSDMFSRMYAEECYSLLRTKGRLSRELNMKDVEVRFDVMELVSLLQVTERVMEVARRSSWDFPLQPPVQNQHERSRRPQVDLQRYRSPIISPELSHDQR